MARQAGNEPDVTDREAFSRMDIPDLGFRRAPWQTSPRLTYTA